MKLMEAWRLSKVPYGEVAYRSLAQTRSGMWWGSFGRADPEEASQDDAEFILRALRIARFDKVVVAAISVVASLIPFWSLRVGESSLSLAGAVALGLAASFAFVMLYSVQTLSSFLKAESWTFLASLPLGRGDLSVITLFSFVRTVDYMVVGAMVSQVAVIALLTRSPLGVLLMLLASAVNMSVAVTLSLWFSKIFYGSLGRGGRSRRATLVRAMFLGLWGLLVVGLGFLFSGTNFLLPSLNGALLGGGKAFAIGLAAVYPFSLSIIVAVACGTVVNYAPAALAAVASVCYAGLAAFLLKWGSRTIREMSVASASARPTVKVEDFELSVKGPLLGYMWKDLRASSRNPATAFFYVLPAFETIVVLISTLNLPLLRAAIVIVAAGMGGAFALFVPLGLLNAEGTGITYTKGLPVKVWTIVSAKASIAVLGFLPVPLTLGLLALFKPLTSPLSLLLPVELVASVAAGSIVEVWLFLGVSAQTRTSAVLHDLIRLLAGVSIMVLPLGAYILTYLVTSGHVLAVVAGGVTAVTELAAIVLFLRRR